MILKIVIGLLEGLIFDYILHRVHSGVTHSQSLLKKQPNSVQMGYILCLLIIVLLTNLLSKRKSAGGSALCMKLLNSAKELIPPHVTN